MAKLKLLLLFCVTVCYGKSINQKQSTKLPFEFTDVYPSKFGQRGFGGTWISGTEFTYSSGGSIVKYNVETKLTETMIPQAFIASKGWRGPSFRFSSDLSKILVRYDQRSIFRHSTVSRFSVINYPNLEEDEFKVADGAEISTAVLASSNDGLSYTMDNNIYFLNLVTFEVTQITDDGVPGVIYNGVSDWVYEEDMFSSDIASWLSPNGQKLAFVRFDDENVREFTYYMYGDGELQYPEEIHLRYPKAGTTNPTVALYFVDLLVPGSKRVLETPVAAITADHIIGTVFWINDNELGTIWLNRRQNHGVFVSYDMTTFAMRQIMAIDEPNGWIEVSTPKCDANSVCYFINHHENWPTLVSVDTKTTPADVRPLSAAGMNVFSFYGAKDGVFYFLSTPKADESFNRHSYTNGNTCLTCDVQTPEGNACSYASTSFSRDFSYYALVCSGPDPSFTRFYKTDGHEMIQSWEENTELRTLLENYDLPQIRHFYVPVAGGFKAVVKMVVPSHIDIDANTYTEKLPMHVDVYAGPGSSSVANFFSIGISTYQVTKKHYIFVEIDGRGTAQNGLDMMFAINNQLGTVEMEDQIAVAKYLVDKYKFIDPERVGISGWSYGGYATAMTLAQDTEKVFKCGISGAPVTAWRFYDTFWTERYMGTDFNGTGYQTSDLATEEHVKEIGRHEFFLIHGNADDNVHYQQSMVLARELQKFDIQFDQLSYPDEAHGFSGSTRLHLYHSQDLFWDKCFK